MVMERDKQDLTLLILKIEAKVWQPLQKDQQDTQKVPSSLFISYENCIYNL